MFAGMLRQLDARLGLAHVYNILYNRLGRIWPPCLPLPVSVVRPTVVYIRGRHFMQLKKFTSSVRKGEIVRQLPEFNLPVTSRTQKVAKGMWKGNICQQIQSYPTGDSCRFRLLWSWLSELDVKLKFIRRRKLRIFYLLSGVRGLISV